ncbi:MAG: 30S ribosomal protein S2 [Deltaproteobacteria bacterium]|nr:30S ribosomal protein S2 [Deltaproteobacteria bacterium]
MVEMTVKEMLESGVHFGHQTHRWNPRMKPFIYGARNGIHIIDLRKTIDLLAKACEFVSNRVAEGGNVLFVGTKRQAQPLVEEMAKKAGMYFMTHRWLGGTLTNFRTIKASIDRLKDLEKKSTEGGLEGLTKKEKLGVEREIIKLTQAMGGIKNMTNLPSVIFIVDPFKEKIALQEAQRLGIPVVAVADTNCNPEGIDYLIPGNDDALKAIRFFTSKIAEACEEGLARRNQVIREEGQEGVGSSREGTKGKAFVFKADKFEDATDGTFKGESGVAGGTK